MIRNQQYYECCNVYDEQEVWKLRLCSTLTVIKRALPISSTSLVDWGQPQSPHLAVQV